MSYNVLLTLLVLCIVAVTLFTGRDAKGNIETLQEYPTGNGLRGVAVDNANFYAICGNSIEKYSKKSGNKIAKQNYQFQHLSSGKIINDDLVVTDSSVGNNALVWINPGNLQIIDVMALDIPGALAWVDFSWGKWWVCSAFYKNLLPETTIYCYNMEWEREGEWRLPEKLLKKIKPWSLAGGDWYGEYLYLSSHDRPELYVVTMPPDSDYAQLIKTIPICFYGQGFVLEKTRKKLFAWGVRRKDKTVVKCNIKS